MFRSNIAGNSGVRNHYFYEYGCIFLKKLIK